MRPLIISMLQGTAEYYVLKFLAPRAASRMAELEYRISLLETRVNRGSPTAEGTTESLGKSGPSRFYIWKYAGKA